MDGKRMENMDGDLEMLIELGFGSGFALRI